MTRLLWPILALALTAQTKPVQDRIETRDCADLPAKFDACAVYTCQFSHPLTGDLFEHRIAGLDGSLCTYTQTMPGGMKMTCALTPESRAAVAKYFKVTMDAMNTGKSISAGVHMDAAGKPVTSMTIDGQTIDDPMSKALNEGACKIGG